MKSMLPRSLVLLVILLLVLPALTQAADTMRIHIVNVGGGDVIFMRCPEGNHELLIDSGDGTDPEAVQRFRSFLTSIQGSNNMIERVIVTHQHPNHLGNMPWVLRNFRIGLYVDSGFGASEPIARNIAGILAERRIAHSSIMLSRRTPDVAFCPLRDVSIRMLIPYGFERYSSKSHARTIVLRLDYLKTAFLFLGDADYEEVKMLMEDPATAPLLNCFFLKADCHDADAGASPELLNLAKSRILVVSGGDREKGKDGRYRRPQYSAIQSLLKHAWPREGPVTECTAWDGHARQWKSVVLRQSVYLTWMDKHLVFETDGENIHKVAATAK